MIVRNCNKIQQGLHRGYFYEQIIKILHYKKNDLNKKLNAIKLNKSIIENTIYYLLNEKKINTYFMTGSKNVCFSCYKLHNWEKNIILDKTDKCCFWYGNYCSSCKYKQTPMTNVDNVTNVIMKHEYDNVGIIFFEKDDKLCVKKYHASKAAPKYDPKYKYKAIPKWNKDGHFDVGQFGKYRIKTPTKIIKEALSKENINLIYHSLVPIHTHWIESDIWVDNDWMDNPDSYVHFQNKSCCKYYLWYDYYVKRSHTTIRETSLKKMKDELTDKEASKHVYVNNIRKIKKILKDELKKKFDIDTFNGIQITKYHLKQKEMKKNYLNWHRDCYCTLNSWEHCIYALFLRAIGDKNATKVFKLQLTNTFMDCDIKPEVGIVCPHNSMISLSRNVNDITKHAVIFTKENNTFPQKKDARFAPIYECCYSLLSRNWNVKWINEPIKN